MSQIVLDPPESDDTPRPLPPVRPSTSTPEPHRILTLAAVVTVVFLVVLVGLVELVFRTAPRAATATSATGALGAAPAGTGAATSVDVALSEFGVTPASVNVPTGKTVTFHVTNKGTIAHDLTVTGGRSTGSIPPGGHADLQAGPFSSSTTAFCSVPGHRQAGMAMTISVTGTPVAAATTSASSSASSSVKVDATAKPGPSWHAFDPTLQPAPGATVHNVTFHAADVTREVAPGVTQTLWTFNGQVPGPTLRGHIGDVFNVTVVNDATMTHSIDFHASQVAPNVAMAPIEPGKSLLYQFKADYSGIWMYHCGTAPAIEHIANGMFGAVIIDPPNLPPVAHEYVFVQSELYFGPQGQAGDMAKMLADTPDAVVFNGYYNQYKFAPIKVEANQRVRIWVLDAGPSDLSSFHIVGTIFDTVFKEGHYELQPGNAAHGGSQALDLLPAQGGFVETSFAQPGLYAMVSHKFADASRGDLGVFQAGGAEGTMNH